MDRLIFNSKLSRRLGDMGMRFWTPPILSSICNETLRTFNALSMIEKRRLEFKSVEGVGFYDLSLLAKDDTNSLPLSRTLTVDDVVRDILRDLVEDFSPPLSESKLTEQFSLLEIRLAVIKARNKLNYLSSLVVSQNNITISGGGDDYIPLPKKINTIKRVIYVRPKVEGVEEGVDSVDRYYRLRKEDEGSSLRFNVGIELTPKTPKYFSTSLQPISLLHLLPPPKDNGILQILSVDSILEEGVDEEEIGGMGLDFPDDLIPYVKWLVEEELFSKEGIGQDLKRVEYCKVRVQEAEVVCNAYSSVLNFRINGKPLPSSSLVDIDDFGIGRSGLFWQNEMGVPRVIGVIGSIIGLCKVPNGVYSINFESIVKAYIPISDGEDLRIKPEHEGVLLDYAFHLGMMRRGSFELNQTMGCYKGLVDLAKKYNQKLVMDGKGWKSNIRGGKREEERNGSFEREE